MSKVSVIVPVFNAQKKLNKCLKTITNQTFKDFELILVNDGSTDKSLEICHKYAKKDNRLTIIDKHNEGSIAARRQGVVASKSKYVMFVDADDWIERNTIEILYREIIKQEADIIVSNMYKVLGSSRLIKQKNNSRYFYEDKLYSKEQILNELVIAYFHGHPFPSSLCAKLYKRELLLESGEYLDRINFLGDDLFYNLEMLLKANKVKVINEALYYYRVGGFTSKYMPNLFNDMVNGYQIQKELIGKFYQNSYQSQLNGISIMLLNTFKTCLSNLFISKFTSMEIKEKIQEYISNETLRETLNNQGSKNYFPQEYLNAIQNKDIKFLYNLGEKLHQKAKPKRILINALSRMTFI